MLQRLENVAHTHTNKCIAEWLAFGASYHVRSQAQEALALIMHGCSSVLSPGQHQTPSCFRAEQWIR